MKKNDAMGRRRVEKADGAVEVTTFERFILDWEQKIKQGRKETNSANSKDGERCSGRNSDKVTYKK